MGRGGFVPGIEGDMYHRERNPWLNCGGKITERVMIRDASVDDCRSLAADKSVTVEAALGEILQLPILQYALLVVQEDGQPKTFTSEGIRDVERTIFTPHIIEKFVTAFRMGSQGSRHDNWSYGDIATDIGSMSRRHSSSNGSSDSSIRAVLGTRFKLENSDDDNVATIKRKRTRGGPSWNSRYSVVPEDDVPIPVTMSHCNQLRIGNTEEVAKFYAQRFKDLQQSACKVVAKAFVKAIEPKKQTNYPYTKGLERAPPWWPPMPSGGEKQEKCVRHKEPDHLYKKERVQLLVHILRLVINPDPEKLQNIKNINIKKLEELTFEAMSNWWNEKDNMLKRPFLKEIFKVAKQEERWRNGELDGDAMITIMHGDERGGLGISDDEPDEGFKYDEDEEGNRDLTPTSNMPTPPESLVSPHLAHLQGSFQPQQGEINYASLPVRPYPASNMDDQLAYTDDNQHSSNYSADRGSAGYHNQPLGAQDHSRRAPWSAHSFPGANPVYTGWASSNNNMLQNTALQFNPFTSHPTTQATTYQLPLPSSAPNQPPLPSMHHQAQNFNDQNIRSFEPTAALRGSAVHQHLVQGPSSFQEYLQDNGGYGHGDADMKDEHIRGQ